MACPECKSQNVHRIEKVRGWDREGKYISLANDEDLSPTISEGEADRRVLMKEESLPPRNPAQKYLTSMISTILNQGKLNGFIERFVKHTP